MSLTDKNIDPVQIRLLRTFSSRPILSLEDDRRYFTNMEEESKKIILAIKTYENAIIIGERGGGKSSLMNHVFHQIEKENEIIPIKINALRIEEFEQTSFILSLLSEIMDVVNKSPTNSGKLKKVLIKMAELGLLGMPTGIGGLSYSPASSAYGVGGGGARGDTVIRSSMSSQNYDLDTIYDRLGALVKQLKKQNINICILVDDIDKIESSLVWKTLRGIRELLWELRISLIITALPPQVSEITNPPLDHFFPYWIKIKPFDDVLTEKAIEKRIKDADVDIQLDTEAIELIVKKTKGNPRSIIELLKNVFESNQLPKIVSKIHLENVGLPYATSLSDTERAVFNYLAHNSHVSASSKDFAERLAVSRSRLAQILNLLEAEGLVASQKDGKRVLYFITQKGMFKRKQSEIQEKSSKIDYI